MLCGNHRALLDNKSQERYLTGDPEDNARLNQLVFIYLFKNFH